MTNTCTKIIMQGKNSGKMCKDVNKQCRHLDLRCLCGFTTDYKRNLTRHKSSCKVSEVTQKPVLQPKPKTKPKSVPVLKKEPQKAESPVYVQPKIPEVNVQDQFDRLFNELNELRNMVKSKPNIIINIQVLGNNVYSDLVNKIGKAEAIHLLTCSAATDRPIDIIKKLYFENTEPQKYPIATKQNYIRYLNQEGELIESESDNFVSNLSDRVRTAMIYATNELIKNSISSNLTDQLYEIYDIGKIQTNLADMNRIKFDGFSTELQLLTAVPNHPFFDPEIKI